MVKNYKYDKAIAVERVKGNDRKRAHLFWEQHKDELSTTYNEHSVAPVNMKVKAKSKVDTVRVQSENKLVRPQRARFASGKRF